MLLEELKNTNIIRMLTWFLYIVKDLRPLTSGLRLQNDRG